MNKNRRSKQLLLINYIPSLTLLFLFCVGCTNQETSLLSKNSIIYCSEGSPETFNPQLTTHSTSIDATAKQFYNRLISLSPVTHKVMPSLAKSWHITQDGLLMTFYLRKNVTFHHTDYFTPSRFFNADDVIFSFNRVLDKTHPYHQVSGGDYPFFSKIDFSKSIQAIEKVNDYTVRFKLSKPDSSLLSSLATDFAVILSQEYAQTLSITDNVQQLDLLPIGTGPFKLKNYRVGSYIRYQPHESYWNGLGDIKQLIFDITPSNTGRLTKLLAGECDVVNNPIAHENIDSRTDLSFDSVTAFNVSYLALNTTKKPLNNVFVRQALNNAINKQNIVDTLFQQKAVVAQAIIPENSWAFPKGFSGQEYSISTAQKKMTESHYVEEFSLLLLVKKANDRYNPDVMTMAEMIAKDLKFLNITVNIVIEGSDEHQELQLSDNDYDMLLHDWSSENVDPNNFFAPLLSCGSTINVPIVSETTPNNLVVHESIIETSLLNSLPLSYSLLDMPNFSQWCNNDFEQSLEQALATNKLSMRKKHYHNALKIIKSEVPIIPISHSKRFLAKSKNISGNMLTAVGGINFQSVRKN